MPITTIMLTIKPKKARKPQRVTRTIGFERAHFEHVTNLAATERRSFNWIVNELVRRDLAESK